MTTKEPIQRERIQQLARDCGFELAGLARAEPHPDYITYRDWTAAGRAGRMGYLTDHRAEVRSDPRHLLETARSILCVGKLYNGPEPYSNQYDGEYLGWVSRYAWGDDYHDILRAGLEDLARRLMAEAGPFDYRVCVDTAPILERSYARSAGLGWIGKNTCLIRETAGSWFFLGELLLSLELPPDSAPPDRCGTCTACIEACPTNALEPWVLDSRLCISYLTIELRAEIPEQMRAGMGRHVFGCDICQDVCPWNRRAPVTRDHRFRPRILAPPLEQLAALSETEFRAMWGGSPVSRARYRGFLRNVAVALGNSGQRCFLPVLERLAAHDDAIVAAHAGWAIEQLRIIGE